MTVIEYCREKTEVGELVIIRSGGYAACAAYIDCEDLFRLPPDINRYEVIGAERGWIKLASPVSDPCNAPCLYLDIE